MERPVKIVIALFLLLLVGFFAYTHFKSWHREKMETAVEKERQEWVGKIQELDKEVDILKGMVRGDQDTAEVKPGTPGETPKIASSGSPGKPKPTCAQLEEAILSFFAYLDTRDYLAAHDIEGTAYDLFLVVVEELTKHPPVITGEMDDLSALIRNVTHFYRVLGKKRIGLIIDIMKHESSKMESVMETFYQWILMGARCKGGLIPPPPLEIVYRYAGFFLNTLGGRSYLLRRDSKTRVLTSYYSILILDRSNDKMKNTYGIDIRPYIDFSYFDIKSQKSLIYQKRYLTTLRDLKQKYQM